MTTTGRCNAEDVGRLLAAYELGALDAAEAARFEAHLLRCPACFESLYEGAPVAAVLRARGAALRSALAPRPPVARALFARLARPVPLALAAAAALVLAVLLTPRRAGDDHERLLALARVEAEPYEPFLLRGGSEADPADAALQEGMSYYDLGRYADAIAPLREAHGRLPDRADIRYYLGLDLLLAGETGEGTRLLEPLALGEGPFRDRAALHVACGHILAGRPERARSFLIIAARGEGPAAERARAILRTLGSS